MIGQSVGIGIIVFLMGCGTDSEAPEDTSGDGACGAVSEHTMVVTGRVQGTDGEFLGAADIRLEDRGWEPGTVLGETTTDGDGSFELPDLEITGVEGCWGILLDYVLVAELEGLTGEKEINHQLFNAIEDGSLAVDVSAFPIMIE